MERYLPAHLALLAPHWSANDTVDPESIPTVEGERDPRASHLRSRICSRKIAIMKDAGSRTAL